MILNLLKNPGGNQTPGNIGSSQGNIVMEKQKQLDSQVNELKKKVQEADQGIQVLEDLQNDHDFKKKALENKVEGEANKPTAKGIQSEEFRELREAAVMELSHALKLADLTQSMIISEMVPKWKQRQQIACIGAPANVCLNQLQNWFTTVAECLQQIRHQLKTLRELNFTYENDPIALNMSSLQEQTLSLFKNLLINSLVVERQPCMPTHPQRPLVLKPGVQFTAKVRLLVKLPELNCQLKVKASFDKDLTEKNTVKGFRKFDIIGINTKVLNMEESNGCLSAEFRHLLLREKRAVGSRANEFPPLLIVEELHSISFDTQLNQADIAINITTTSLPVVVINPMTPLPSGWASILWFNMLCTDYQNLAFFLNPPPMMWGDLAKVLSWQFSSVTKRGLNTDQLSMLADKLLGPEAERDPNTAVYWSKFSKENIPGKSFSFFRWLYSILELIKNQLLPVWIDGYIMGFVSKEMERALLKDRESGTFLLRFSESHLGGITFTWVEQENGEAMFLSVEPFTQNHLRTLPIADIIRDFKIDAGIVARDPLKFLYPDIPKDEAFGKHYNSQKQGIKE